MIIRLWRIRATHGLTEFIDAIKKIFIYGYLIRLLSL